jgi:hypothetical protein
VIEVQIRRAETGAELREAGRSLCVEHGEPPGAGSPLLADTARPGAGLPNTVLLPGFRRTSPVKNPAAAALAMTRVNPRPAPSRHRLRLPLPVAPHWPPGSQSEPFELPADANPGHAQNSQRITSRTESLVYKVASKSNCRGSVSISNSNNSRRRCSLSRGGRAGRSVYPDRFLCISSATRGRHSCTCPEQPRRPRDASPAELPLPLGGPVPLVCGVVQRAAIVPRVARL